MISDRHSAMHPVRVQAQTCIYTYIFMPVPKPLPWICGHASHTDAATRTRGRDEQR